MSVTFTQFPTYPVPGKPVRLGFTATVGSYVKLFITDAPRDSEFYAKIQETSANQLLVHSGDEADGFEFLPDVSGKYLFTVQDITKGASVYGGGYLHSPDGYKTETINSTQTGVTIEAGTRCDMRCGYSGHEGVIRFYIWEDTVRETNEETHGEATPAIVDTTSERVELAARSTNVVTALSNLIGQLDTTIIGTGAEAVFNDIRSNYADHIADVGAAGPFHANTDTDNGIDPSFANPDNPARLSQSVSEMLRVFSRHMQNDDPNTAPSRPGSGDYHQIGGANVTDYAHATTADQPGSQADSVIALADLWWAYEAHRVSTAVHTAADTNNTLTALGVTSVWLVHQYLMTELAKTNPTAGATDNAGAIRVAAELGMTTE
jgi:hypothetical protein